MSSSARKTSRTPRRGTRKKRWGRRHHRDQCAVEKLRRLLALEKDETARLRARPPVGSWARLWRWLFGAPECAKPS